MRSLTPVRFVVTDLYTALVHDALQVLDRHRLPIERRDPAKSLDEDPGELLRRLRTALEPLALKRPCPAGTVTQLLSRIDEALAGSASVEAASRAPRMP